MDDWSSLNTNSQHEEIFSPDLSLQDTSTTEYNQEDFNLPDELITDHHLAGDYIQTIFIGDWTGPNTFVESRHFDQGEEQRLLPNDWQQQAVNSISLLDSSSRDAPPWPESRIDFGNGLIPPFPQGSSTEGSASREEWLYYAQELLAMPYDASTSSTIAASGYATSTVTIQTPSDFVPPPSDLSGVTAHRGHGQASQQRQAVAITRATPVTTRPPRQMRYSCDICEDIFHDACDLKRHRSSKHNMAKKHLVCLECARKGVVYENARDDKMGEHCRDRHGQSKGGYTYRVVQGPCVHPPKQRNTRTKSAKG